MGITEAGIRFREEQEVLTPSGDRAAKEIFLIRIRLDCTALYDCLDRVSE